MKEFLKYYDKYKYYKKVIYPFKICLKSENHILKLTSKRYYIDITIRGF